MNAQYLAMPNNYFTLVVFGGQEISQTPPAAYAVVTSDHATADELQHLAGHHTRGFVTTYKTD